MSTSTQLRITDPQDRLKIHDLDDIKGITTLGQDVTNDIVLKDPGVVPFQLMLDYRQQPYRLAVPKEAGPAIVNDKSVPAGGSCEIHDRDEIRVAGYTIVFRVYAEEPDVPDEVPQPPIQPEPSPPPPDEVPAPPVQPEPGPPPSDEVPGPPAQPEPSPPPPDEPAIPDSDHTEPAILTELSEPAQTIAVEHTASFELAVINGGDLVASFDIAAEGVPQEWITISPPQIHLNEKEKGTVDIAITPPRLPASRAGLHQIALVVTSPIYPEERSQASATLTIQPYYELAVGNLSPRRLSISGGKPAGQTEVPLTNRGNSDVVVLLAGEDNAHACRFEFEIPDELEGALYLTKEIDLRLPVDGMVRLPVRLVPQSRPLIGAGGRLVDLHPRVNPYTIAVTMAQGQQTPWTLAGEWENKPRFGRWILFVSALALILFVLAIFDPEITNYSFSADPGSIRAGQIVELTWKARPLITFKLNGQSVKPPVSLRPEQTTTYEWRAETWLSRLLPFLTKTDERRVEVRPVEPDILLFEALPEQVPPGGKSVLSWLVDDASELVLIDHSAELEETLVSPCGSREIHVGQVPVRYTLRAVAADGRAIERAVAVQVASPTIQVFSARPAAITAPTDIKLSWWVRGLSDTDMITLSYSSFDGSGGESLVALSKNTITVEKVAKTTVFSLSVSSGGKQVVETERIKVLKPTPIPATVKTQNPASPPALTQGTIIVYTALSEQEMKKILIVTDTATLTNVTDSSTQTDLTLDDQRKFDYVATLTNAPTATIQIVRLSTQDLIRQLLAEKENPQADVIWGVAATGMLRLRAEGLLEPMAGPYQPKGLENIPAGWRDPTFPPQWLGLSAWPAAFCVNEDKLKTLHDAPSPPRSWKDLTKSIYHGQIVMPDPYRSGTGYMVVSGLLQMDPFGEPAGWAYLDLLHENIAWYTDKGYEPCELVAQSGYPAIGISAASVFIPDTVKTFFPEEGSGWEMDAVALVRKDVISEGARAFIEWAISKEAMLEYAQFRPIVSYEGLESMESCFKEFDRNKMIPNRLLWASANYERIAEEWLSRYAGEPDLVQLETVR